jgi:hypothetical protein
MLFLSWPPQFQRKQKWFIIVSNTDFYLLLLFLISSHDVIDEPDPCWPRVEAAKAVPRPSPPRNRRLEAAPRVLFLIVAKGPFQDTDQPTLYLWLIAAKPTVGQPTAARSPHDRRFKRAAHGTGYGMSPLALVP